MNPLMNPLGGGDFSGLAKLAHSASKFIGKALGKFSLFNKATDSLNTKLHTPSSIFPIIKNPNNLPESANTNPFEKKKITDLSSGVTDLNPTLKNSLLKINSATDLVFSSTNSSTETRDSISTSSTNPIDFEYDNDLGREAFSDHDLVSDVNIDRLAALNATKEEDLTPPKTSTPSDKNTMTEHLTNNIPNINTGVTTLIATQNAVKNTPKDSLNTALQGHGYLSTFMSSMFGMSTEGHEITKFTDLENGKFSF